MSRLDAIKQQAAQVADTGLDMSQSDSSAEVAQSSTATSAPFDSMAAIRALRAKGVRLDGAALTAELERMERRYCSTGSYAAAPATAQSIVRRHMGKAKAQRQEMTKELNALGYLGRYASAGEVLDLMTAAHDCALGADRPSARALLRHQVGEADAPRLASTRSRHVKSAMRKLENHPTAKLMETQGMRTARDVSEICRSTLAGGVQALYQRADVAKRLAGLSDTQAEQAREIAVLKARLAALETRQDVAESGEHWHDVAKRMRFDGASYGAIAKSTGQSRSTVSSYLARQP
ncbi:hypothetical protein [Pseudomonas oryzihabitans]|uniref:hypothetical protein n=1 Tax=Pseudomonas oryzihabitans TaxID=47885 RepID=UPI002894558B|nr:hypothetical protein [Pseudomonas oryzihabitans]MDT3718401.1 hypothetical protein [Pseudomonas oryzihabitans]